MVCSKIGCSDAQFHKLKIMKLSLTRGTFYGMQIIPK